MIKLKILVTSLLLQTHHFYVSAADKFFQADADNETSDSSLNPESQNIAACITGSPGFYPSSPVYGSPLDYHLNEGFARNGYPMVHDYAEVASMSPYAARDLSESSPNFGPSHPKPESRKRKLEKYFGTNSPSEDKSNSAKVIKPDDESAKQIRNAFKPNFDKLLNSWVPGLVCELPLKKEFFYGYSPTDYLALAIKYRDVMGMKYSKEFISFQDVPMGQTNLYVSPLLQRVFIDLITIQDVPIITTLGENFPGIFTHVISFEGGLKNLNSTSLIRLAFDQKKTTALTAMFFSVPSSYIEDFWNLSDDNRGYFIEAIAEGILPLKGNTCLSERVVRDMFFTSVTLDNIAAVKRLKEWGLIKLTENFTDPLNGLVFTALYYAAHANYTDLFRYLGQIEPILYTIPTSTGMLPVHVAALNGNLDMLKILSEVKGCFTATVIDRGVDLTPFAMAWRNNKREAALYILAQLIDHDLDGQMLYKELLNLASWAILEDNPDWLAIVLEGNHLPIDGRFPGNEFSLLEMVVRGTVDPSDKSTKRCSVKCLEYLSKEWKARNLSVETFCSTLGIRGSILGLVHPDDIDAFIILLDNLGLNPNEPIWLFKPNSYSPEERSQAVANSCRTTFLINTIEQHSTFLVNVAIKRGADPRIVSFLGFNAFESAKLAKNTHAINLLKQFEDEEVEDENIEDEEQNENGEDEEKSENGED